MNFKYILYLNLVVWANSYTYFILNQVFSNENRRYFILKIYLIQRNQLRYIRGFKKNTWNID